MICETQYGWLIVKDDDGNKIVSGSTPAEKLAFIAFWDLLSSNLGQCIEVALEALDKVSDSHTIHQFTDYMYAVAQRHTHDKQISEGIDQLNDIIDRRFKEYAQ